MSQVASVGRIVHMIVNPTQNNGSTIAPAVITRVWGEPFEGADGLGRRVTVNLRVLLDQADVPWLTSVELFDERPDEEALAAARPHNCRGYSSVAFWPPRGG